MLREKWYDIYIFFSVTEYGDTVSFLSLVVIDKEHITPLPFSSG